MTETTIQLLQPIPGIETFTLVKVPAGSFIMGSKEFDRSQPFTEITFTHDFYMGQYPVTQELWQHIMGNNPAHFKGSKRPVEQVSWDDICNKDGFLDKLNGLAAIKTLFAKPPYKGMCFALPSETQWEYAARGGAEGQKDGFDYAGSSYIDQVAWFYDNSHQETKPVGLKAPNQLGLYDMSGNVWEWCADDWTGDCKGMLGDGRPYTKNTEIALSQFVRGGCFFDYKRSCHTACRGDLRPSNRSEVVGFRLVLSDLACFTLGTGVKRGLDAKYK